MHLSKIFIASALFTAILTGCKKEQGCRDQFAANYSETAEEDDGSCVFSDIEVVFWMNEERMNHYESNGAYFPLHVEVSGVELGEFDEENLLETKPDCATIENVVKYTKVMPDREGYIEYAIVDYFGDTYYSVSKVVSSASGTCQAILF
jgi:hypothetical protein